MANPNYELREMSDHELGLRLIETQNDLINMRFALATRQGNNSAHVRLARRQIARIKTILNERRQEEA